MPWRRVQGPQVWQGGPGAASDWLRGCAASFLRTCAVAPRRGQSGVGARWVPGRASQDRLHGRLQPRRRSLRDGRGGAEAPPQRGTEPATQAPRPSPLLPGASRAARLRVPGPATGQDAGGLRGRGCGAGAAGQSPRSGPRASDCGVRGTSRGWGGEECLCPVGLVRSRLWGTRRVEGAQSWSPWTSGVGSPPGQACSEVFCGNPGFKCIP